MKTKIKIFLLFIVLLCPIVYSRFFVYRAYVNIPEKIKIDPSVLDAKILSNEELIFGGFTIEVLFNNGNSMKIQNVNNWGKGKKNKPMDIYYVNGYLFAFVNKNNGKRIMLSQELKLWSAIIGVRLETITDIIKNYSAIGQHIENGTNLVDYYMEDADVLYSEVIKKVIDENLYSETFIFNGQEYFLVKYPDFVRWKYF
jgi:hypothetical protein